MKITGDNIIQVLDCLHNLGPSIVIITSVIDQNQLVLYASSRKELIVFEIRVPLRKTSYAGTGDLFTALVLAYLNKFGIVMACERAVDTIQAVLDNTEIARRQCGEIAIIQSASLILNPPEMFKALVLNDKDI
jgi:pyridoxal/pyridoxine/pyridoxamine kinase